MPVLASDFLCVPVRHSPTWTWRAPVTGRGFSVGTPATYGILVKNSDIDGNIANTNEIYDSGHTVVGSGSSMTARIRLADQ